MAKKKPYAAIFSLALIGILFIGLGVSGAAGQFQQGLDSWLNSNGLPNSLTIYPAVSTTLTCYYGQTVTAAVSGGANNPYGTSYVYWYLDGYSVSGSESGVYTTSSTLAVGSHTLVAQDWFDQSTVTFTVIVSNPVLTVAKSGSGSVSISVGTHAYAVGTHISITATPASGYQFSHWARGTTYVFTSTDIFNMPASDLSTTAVFVQVPATPTPSPVPTAVPTAPPTPTPSPSPSPSPSPAPQVALTMGTSGSGTISKSAFYKDGDVVPFYMSTVTPGTTFYCDVNSKVKIAASEDYGYTFSYWLLNDGTKDYSASTTLTMSASRTALAVFVSTATPTPTPLPEYTLSMSISGSGTITPSIGPHTYTSGTTAYLTATASSGYHFSYWLFENGAKDYAASTSLSMTQSRSAIAVFIADDPEVTPAPEPTPLPTAKPQPTAAPETSPTPIPTVDSDPNNTDDYDNSSSTPYIDANQLCIVGGAAALIIDGLWLALVKKWI